MTWVRVDDGFPEHTKALRAGDDACWLFVAGLCFCARNLTDGRILTAQVPRLTGLRNPVKLAGRLVDAELWDTTDDGYLVRNYTEYQPTKEQVRNRRETTAKRVRKHRSNGVTNGAETSLPHAGGGARAAGEGGSTATSHPFSQQIDAARATISDDRINDTVQILRGCARLTFDLELIGVANTLAAHPEGDHRKAAHVAVANASDPAYRTTDAARALHYAFEQIERSAGKVTAIAARRGGDARSRTDDDVAELMAEAQRLREAGQ